MIDITKVREVVNSLKNIRWYNNALVDSFTSEFMVINDVVAELERLQKFKKTFDNYKLSQKQGFIAYENWQECEKQIKELQKKVKSLHVMQTYQCLSCEREIRDTWKYCPYCGVELDWSAE